MILYSLKNAVFELEVYEDRLRFKPRWLLQAVAKNWREEKTVHFHSVQRVELRQRLWPVPHELNVHTKDDHYCFRFRQPLVFFQRLAPYLERQAEKYRNHPEAFPTPVKTVLDLVEERRVRERERKFRPGAAA